MRAPRDQDDPLLEVVLRAAHAFFGPRGLAVKVGRRGKPPGHRNAYVVRRE